MNSLPSAIISRLSPETENLNVPIIHAIVNHLEFLGYEVAINDPLGQVFHPRKFNFSFYRAQVDIVTFVVLLPSKEYGRVMQEDFYRFINAVNESDFVGHFSITEDFDIMAKFAYVGNYNKATFARMFELWEVDIGSLLNYTESADFV